MCAREVEIDDEPPQLRRERRMPSLEGGGGLAIVDGAVNGRDCAKDNWPGGRENWMVAVLFLRQFVTATALLVHGGGQRRGPCTPLPCSA
jgi:hypothetical protein